MSQPGTPGIDHELAYHDLNSRVFPVFDLEFRTLRSRAIRLMVNTINRGKTQKDLGMMVWHWTCIQSPINRRCQRIDMSKHSHATSVSSRWPLNGKVFQGMNTPSFNSSCYLNWTVWSVILPCHAVCPSFGWFPTTRGIPSLGATPS